MDFFRGFRWIISNPNDVIQRHHHNGEFFEKVDLELIKDYIRKDDVILDIGANVGNHAIFLSKYTKASRIIVVEPIETIYKTLLANVALNYAHNIDLNYIGIALGHKKDLIGYPYLTYGEDNLGAASISPTPINDPNVHTFSPVRITTGDSLFSEEIIDFIKIDVEGMEILVLKGLEETIRKNRPKIYIEVSKQNEDIFWDWLNANGYEIQKSITHPGAEHVYCNHLILPVDISEESV